MPYFTDRAGVLSNKRRTATGGFLVDATLARTGVLDYYVEGKLVRRYNPAAVLEAALDAIATVPVTNLHPEEMVTPDNYKDVAAGHVVGTPVYRDGVVYATLAIQDAALIRDIELGVSREVSMGYYADHDGAAGEADGEAYDEARTVIQYNHAAIVPCGRAGKNVRLQLDSAEIPREMEDSVEIKIKGVVVGLDKLQAAVDALEGELMAASTLATQTKAELDAKVVELTEATSETALDARVAERATKAQAAKDAADKLERVKAAFPAIDLTNAAASYIDGLDAGLAAFKKADPDGLKKLSSLAVDAKEEEETTDAEPVKTSAQLRAEMLVKGREAGRAPLSK